jgi:hypothetical protein
VKPTLASWRIIARRVNASARKTMSPSTSWTSLMSHCQNGIGFVCGLSTLNTFTPSSTHSSVMRRSSCHSASQSGVSQFRL